MYREKVEEEHVGKDQIGKGAKYVELFWASLYQLMDEIVMFLLFCL